MALNKDIIRNPHTTKHTGDIGERIAATFLKKRGFTVIETNYKKKWGELDIVGSYNNIIHFVEVKTNAYTDKDTLYKGLTGDNWQPEDRVHQFKLRQIEKALETWLAEHEWEGEWQIDVVSVKIVHEEQYAVVDLIEHVNKA